MHALVGTTELDVCMQHAERSREPSLTHPIKHLVTHSRNGRSFCYVLGTYEFVRSSTYHQLVESSVALRFFVLFIVREFLHVGLESSLPMREGCDELSLFSMGYL